MIHRLHAPRLGLSLVLAVFASACGDDEPENDNTNDNSAQTPAVGFAELTLEYTPDGLPAAETSRSIDVKVWYPATTDGSDSGANYAVAGIIEVDAPEALDGPPPASGTHPVAVYSHGSRGDGLLAYPFGEAFAAAGWILVSPGHTGNTILDDVSDTAEPFSRLALFRPQDVSAVLDWLESSEAPALVGNADTSQVFVTGHSFGGSTTLSLAGADLDYDTLVASCGDPTSDDCEFLAGDGVEAAFDAGTADSRVAATAPQAPALISAYGAGEVAAIDTPVMLMSGRLDQTTTQTESADPAWAALNQSGNIWIDIPTGAHYTFITICDDLPGQLRLLFLPTSDDDGCGDQFISSAEAVPVISDYLLAFAEWRIRGVSAESSLFDQTIEGFVVTQP